MSSRSIYNFGISQEDARTELQALDLKESDSLLCIASGGEIPLNLLALTGCNIVACDTSIEQIHLSKLKLAAILHLEQHKAARLIGFYKAKNEDRLAIYDELRPKLSQEEVDFWDKNIEAIQKGVINVARFEKYILKFSWVLRFLLGKGKLMKLMTLEDVDEQRNFFDKKISNLWVKLLFKVAFHPKIYKNRGMDEHGLQHQKDASISTFFYNRFRDFCTSTLASKNYYFQYTFFNEVLYEKALPEYLCKEGINRIRSNSAKLHFVNSDFTSVLNTEPNGRFNKFHLSNIGDWLSKDEMELVYEAIHMNGASNSSLVVRYIHHNHPIPEHFEKNFNIDLELGKKLITNDRYPFYQVIPATYHRG
ncbi:MAG: DUF3419 family protein [Crocinitomicaceae bacterium]